MKGIIIKGVGGFYTVDTGDGEYICRARGKFRIGDVAPLVGDAVEIDAREGYIIDILPRKNQLLRPAAANIDQALIVVAASRPKPDLLLVDKLLLQAQMLGIASAVVINKLDEAGGETLNELERNYAGIFTVIKVCAAGENVSELEALLKGKTSCFAGQSAVGKTSLLNRLVPEAASEIGELSKKTARGKHTTRHTQLWRCAQDALLLDTPGFSAFEIDTLEPEELSAFYPDLARYKEKCYYTRCVHIAEPNCAVKAALERGEVYRPRYERYIQLIDYLKEHRRTKHG
jgi:ribosome biogenesis GTPase